MSTQERQLEDIASHPHTFGSIRFNRIRCLRSRHANSSCRACFEACPTQAIKEADGVPYVSPIDCTECGTCAGACPTGAVEITQCSDSFLIQELSAKASAKTVFVCSQVKNSDAEEDIEHIALKCLQRLDPTLLLSAAHAGAAKVVLKTGICSQCPNHCERRSVKQLVERTRDWAQALGKSLVIEHMEKQPEINLKRRMFFGGFVKKVKTVDRLSEEKSKTNTPSASAEAQNQAWTQIPEKRVRLITTLKLKSAPTNQTLGPEGFFVPEMNREQCVGCGMCVTSCPTGCLIFKEEGSTQHYSALPLLCLGCNLCTESCYKDAIHPIAVAVDDQRLSGMPVSLGSIVPAEDLLSASWEDKITKMFNVPIYRS